jgi:hypothetical protein
VPITITRKQFSEWFSGFVDGEGNFQVFFDSHYLRLFFRIRLHVDDINVLYTIQKFLNVGTVRIEGTSCIFVISNLHDLLTVLIPLLDQYKLHTSKFLDYQDFKLAASFLSSLSNTRPTGNDIVWLRSLIAGMNSGRITSGLSSLPVPTISPF